MVKINALGDTCPIPVVKTSKAIKELNGPGEVEVLVDNETAVKNLIKMSEQKGYDVSNKKIEDKKYQVNIIIEENDIISDEEIECISCKKKNTVVVISNDKMGEGDDELGKTLLKGFIYALSEQNELPSTILFYNGGVKVACEGSDSIDDLKALEAAGVEIYTCGTCLNFYGLSEKLEVGNATNMYAIAETMTGADLIVKP